MRAGAVKIWITGANGRVGTAFANLWNPMEAELLLTDADEVAVTDMETVIGYADLNRPDVIINCAAMTDVELCEQNKEDAFRVNALGARNLSMAARKVNATIVQLSTDDVFDGTSNVPYDEFAPTNPLTVYGRSKLAGENFVRELTPKHLIIRSSWVYGNGKNFVTDLLERAKTEKEIAVGDGQFASPTSAAELAKVIRRLIEAGENGIYNAVCEGYCSRYEFAWRIVQLAGLDTKIVRSPRPQVPGATDHPSYAVLDNLMLRISGIETPIHWTEALKNFMRGNGYLKKE